MIVMSRQKPNIVRITDGLGNQLFQYAFAYGLYKRTGRDIVLDPMYSGHLRQYQLSSFQIDFSTKFVGNKMDSILGMGYRNSALFRLKYREQKVKKGRYEKISESSPMKYDDKIYRENHAYYVGFWQSYQYFDQYYDEIKRQFQTKKKLSVQGERYCNDMTDCSVRKQSVSLHIRRTDYNRIENNVCLGDLFYRQALNDMQHEIGDFSLYIFTDDKKFVKEKFHFYDYTLVEGLSDLEEFVLMQKCQHHIIANSTFSWWGAYLAENKGGIVYAPVVNMWTEQFYLPQWNKVNAQVGYIAW